MNSDIFFSNYLTESLHRFSEGVFHCIPASPTLKLSDVECCMDPRVLPAGCGHPRPPTGAPAEAPTNQNCLDSPVSTNAREPDANASAYHDSSPDNSASNAPLEPSYA
jgi:hypothetical protein